jgi:hypothetical protein
MDKTIITRTFNKTISEFLDDIIEIIPEKQDVQNTKMYLDAIKSINPSLLIKVWYKHIYEIYGIQIESGDISFFINKNYVEDINIMQNANEVLHSIDKIRGPIRDMSEKNKEISMKYLQKLTQLSVLYNNM